MKLVTLHPAFRLFMAYVATWILPCLPGFAVEKTSLELTEPKVARDTTSLKLPAALEAEGFTRFAAMIEAAGLTETLEGDGPFTCFAPTDEALVAMPDERKKQLEADPKGDDTMAWIKYHFVKEVALKREDLMNIPDANSYSNRPLVVWVSLEKITINRVCEITRSDIVAANGVIHGVARVLDAEDEKVVLQRKAPER